MKHTIQIIALDEYPAVLCSCNRWGYAFTAKRGETIETKRQMLRAAFDRHCEYALAQELLDNTTPARHL